MIKNPLIAEVSQFADNYDSVIAFLLLSGIFFLAFAFRKKIGLIGMLLMQVSSLASLIFYFTPIILHELVGIKGLNLSINSYVEHGGVMLDYDLLLGAVIGTLLSWIAIKLTKFFGFISYSIPNQKQQQSRPSY